MKPGDIVVVGVAVVVVGFFGVLLVQGGPSPLGATAITGRMCEDTQGGGFAATDTLGTITPAEMFPVAYRVLPSTLDGHALDYTLFTVTGDSDADGDGERDVDGSETGGAIRPSAGSAAVLLPTRAYAFLVEATGSDGRTGSYGVTLHPCGAGVAYLYPDPDHLHWEIGVPQTLWLDVRSAVGEVDVVAPEGAMSFMAIRDVQGSGAVLLGEAEAACEEHPFVRQFSVQQTSRDPTISIQFSGIMLGGAPVTDAHRLYHRITARHATELYRGNFTAVGETVNTSITASSAMGLLDPNNLIVEMWIDRPGDDARGDAARDEGVRLPDTDQLFLHPDRDLGPVHTSEENVRITSRHTVALRSGMGVDVVPCYGGHVEIQTHGGGVLQEYTIAPIQPTPTPTPTPTSTPTPTPLPALSIVGGGVVTEGGTAVFTLTSDPAPAAPLPVGLSVTGRGGYVTDGTATVSVPESGTYTHFIATTDDTVDEVNGSVTVAIATPGTSPSYSIRTGTAVVDVLDDDAPASDGG